MVQHELPLTHSLDLVPRPFSSGSRRAFRLGLDVPRGYFVFAMGAPYYHRRRRRPVHQQCFSRRAELWQRRLRRARLVAVPLAAFVRCEAA